MEDYSIPESDKGNTRIWGSIVSVRSAQRHRHTYPYVQNFLANTVAAFGLLLNEEPGGTTAGRTFSDVLHLVSRTEMPLLAFAPLKPSYLDIVNVQYRPEYSWPCTSGVWICVGRVLEEGRSHICPARVLLAEVKQECLWRKKRTTKVFVWRLGWCRSWRLRALTEAGRRTPALGWLWLMEDQRRGFQTERRRLKRGPQVREEKRRLGAGRLVRAGTMMEEDKRRRADGVMEIGPPPPPSPTSAVREAPRHTCEESSPKQP